MRCLENHVSEFRESEIQDWFQVITYRRGDAKCGHHLRKHLLFESDSSRNCSIEIGEVGSIVECVNVVI